MITIISGVPGSGKTSKVIEMIMEELQAGRKIFTVGIPELLLNVQKGGDPHTWQNGSWLQIDSYQPDITKLKGIESQWFPRGCPQQCPYLSTCPKIGLVRPDAGALIVLDEAHQFFPQRASGKVPPPYIEALNVHRHQGLDFWVLTQRPSFLDPFIRGLSSRHLHIAPNPFSFNGSRNLYEWAEYQETVNRSSKLLAKKTSYKPSPAVFPLYKSATLHTKLNHSMPTIMRVFIIILLIFFAVAGYAIYRTKTRINDLNNLSATASSASSLQPVKTLNQPLTTSATVPNSSPYILNSPQKIFVSACISSSSKCVCYTKNGMQVYLGDLACRAAAHHPTEDFDYAKNEYDSSTVTSISSSSALPLNPVASIPNLSDPPLPVSPSKFSK